MKPACVALFIILFITAFNIKFSGAQENEVLSVFVSVLPQKYFVERIGEQRVSVSVLVGPGQSPATYEPTSRQMNRLSESLIYFSIGVPFEKNWMKRLTAINPQMQVFDMGKGIDRRSFAEHKETSHHTHDRNEGKDPHIWTSPPLVKIMAKQTLETLSELAPQHRKEFYDNYALFIKELEDLDQDIRQTLSPYKSKKFLVFHPSWGYFAETYGLNQIAIEFEGKEPGARALSALINVAQKENIRVIFVQKQFSRRLAETVAKAIDGQVVAVDPLAENYIENLRNVTAQLASALEQQ